MIKDGHEDPDPRNKVLTDLTKFMNNCKDDGYEVILGIDANEAMEVNESKIKKFMEVNGLHDIHHTLVKDLPTTTRVGSRHRIDFLFASERLLQWIRSAGTGAIDDGIQSDHILLWADFDMSGFLGCGLGSHNNSQSRPFAFDNIEIREKFIANLKEAFDKHNVPKQIRTLEVELKVHGISTERARKYNAIDKDIVRATKAALNQTVKQKQHGCPRSRALTEAGNRVLFWKSLLASANRGYPTTDKAKNLGKRLEIDVNAAAMKTTKQLDKATTKAWDELRECQLNAT